MSRAKSMALRGKSLVCAGTAPARVVMTFGQVSSPTTKRNDILRFILGDFRLYVRASRSAGNKKVRQAAHPGCLSSGTRARASGTEPGKVAANFSGGSIIPSQFRGNRARTHRHYKTKLQIVEAHSSECLAAVRALFIEY